MITRQKLITLLVFSSFVATMITVRRFSSYNYEDNPKIIMRHTSIQELTPLFKNRQKPMFYQNSRSQMTGHLLVKDNHNKSSANIINKLRDHHSEIKVKIARNDIQINESQKILKSASKRKIIVSDANDAEEFKSNKISENIPIVSNDPIVPIQSVPLVQSLSSSSASTSSSILINLNAHSDINVTPEIKSLVNNNNNAIVKRKESKLPQPKTKLTYDLNDLKTTEKMKIDKTDFCDTDHGATIDLLVMVISTVGNFDARDAIRSTWGRFAVERGASFLFLLGSTLDNRIQQKIIAEDSKYNDILQGYYIDNYYNLTLKTISMMKWVRDNCAMVKYVLKVDDDMFLNMQHITDFSETRTFSKVIIGKLAKGWKPHRQPKNKWYVPQSAYNGSVFPNFATGPAYLFTGDSAEKLYNTSISLTPIYLEDVYMTGIVAEKAGIKRLNHGLMRNAYVKIDPCVFRKIMTSHKHPPSEIRRLWDLVYVQPQRPCDTKKRRTPSESSASLQKPQQKTSPVSG